MNIEEKAKRYAQSVVDESVENYIGDEIYNSHIEYASQCYTAGYTQAVTDLSAENEQLREALRELVKEAEGYVIPDADKANNSQYDNYIEIDDFKSLVTKAKQLITDP